MPLDHRKGRSQGNDVDFRADQSVTRTGGVALPAGYLAHYGIQQKADPAAGASEAAPAPLGETCSSCGAPVQMKASGSVAESHEVHAAAEHGLSGGGGAMPHLDAVQRSFGVHDLGGVEAHVGGKASEGARAMGALAYATGNRIAFAGAPDLHTAAHEAAHVIQQRDGVHLKGGVGESGDAYERHADAVADLVVQGKSAESLLGPARGGAIGSSVQRLVQRKDDPPAGKSVIDQLREALSGWGSDNGKIQGLLAHATDPEKQQILADQGLMAKLKDKLSRAQMIEALNNLHAPLKLKLTAAMDGWGCDSAAIKAMVASPTTTDAERTAVMTDAAMVARLQSELSRADMLEVLGSLHAPLKDRLEAAIHGWGCDGEAIKKLSSTAPDPERAAVLADAGMVARLRSKLSRADMLELLKNLHAPLKDRLNTAMDGWGIDGPAIADMIKNSSAADIAAALADQALVDRLVSNLGNASNDTLRQLFAATPDAQIATMKQWMKLRFHRDFGADAGANGVDWTPAMLRQLWGVLENLPPSMVQNNKNLRDFLRYQGTGSAGGVFRGGTKDVAMSVGGDGNLADPNTAADPGDPLYGKNRFDKVVRHEVGHAMDAQVGGSAYAATAAGWASIAAGSVASTMVAAAAGDISRWADAGEKNQIIAALQGVVAADAPTTIDAVLGALPFVSDLTHPDQAAKLAKIKADPAVAQLRKCFASQSPWYRGFGDTFADGKVYQEGYEGDWVSYNAEARARKVSQYQFRHPAEWFAEAFATYYEPGPKGALLAVDPGTKAFFDAHVDPEHGAGSTGDSGAGPRAPAPAPGGHP